MQVPSKYTILQQAYGMGATWYSYIGKSNAQTTYHKPSAILYKETCTKIKNKCILKNEQEVCTNKGSFYSILLQFLTDTSFEIKKAGAGTRTIPDQYVQKTKS